MLVSAIVSAIAAYQYAAHRSRGATRGGASQAGGDQSHASAEASEGAKVVSVTGARDVSIDQSDRRSTSTINVINPVGPPIPPRRGLLDGFFKGFGRALDDFLEEAGIAGLVVVAVIAWLLQAVVANMFVDARGPLLFALFVAGSVTLGLAVGAWLGIRRHLELEKSWRWPLLCGAVVCGLTYVDMWLLTHPTLATGTLDEIIRPFASNQGHVIELARRDSDATAFLAFQGLGAVGALIACVSTLFLLGVLWANVEAQLRVTPALPVRLTRRLFGGLPVGRLLAAVLLLAVFSSAFASGAVHRLAGHASLSAEPELRNVRIAADARSILVRAASTEPAVLRADVYRLAKNGKRRDMTGGDSNDCRPGRRCMLAFPAQRDGTTLSAGLYEVRVRATNERGVKSKPRGKRFRLQAGP